METQEIKTVDLSKLTASQLTQELKKREVSENKKLVQVKKDHLKRKQGFLKEVTNQFVDLNKILKDLKGYAISEANQIWKEMYEIEGKVPKEQKRITVQEGDFKIVVEHRDNLVFTDEASVHIDSIQAIMKEKFELRNKGLYGFLESILMKNGKGDYDPKLLAKAKKNAIELGIDELIIELDKLQNCQTVTGTSKYCRVYQKAKNGGWKEIVLQFSSF